MTVVLTIVIALLVAFIVRQKRDHDRVKSAMQEHLHEKTFELNAALTSLEMLLQNESLEIRNMTAALKMVLNES